MPAATPVLLNLAMIVAAWLGAPWFGRLGLEPIYAMAAGVMAGGVLQLAVQVPALKRLGLLPRIGLGWTRVRDAWRDAGVRQVLGLMLPALLGVGVGDALVRRRMAEGHPVVAHPRPRRAHAVPLCRIADQRQRPLAGTDPAAILLETRKVLRGEGKLGRRPHLWDGRAAERIVGILARGLDGQ